MSYLSISVSGSMKLSNSMAMVVDDLWHSLREPGSSFTYSDVVITTDPTSGGVKSTIMSKKAPASKYTYPIKTILG